MLTIAIPTAVASSAVEITERGRRFYFAVTKRIFLIRRLRGNLEASRHDGATEHIEHRFDAVGNEGVWSDRRRR